MPDIATAVLVAAAVLAGWILFGGFRRAEQRGVRYRLAAVPPPILRHLEKTGVTRLMTIYDSVPAALAAECKSLERSTG